MKPLRVVTHDVYRATNCAIQNSLAYCHEMITTWAEKCAFFTGDSCLAAEISTRLTLFSRLAVVFVPLLASSHSDS